jgi:hypothetical protein
LLSGNPAARHHLPKTTISSEGRQMAAFRILGLATERTTMRWKAKVRDRQNKNRSKPAKQGRIASTSKYSESLFFWVEEGTIARIDAVLERFEHRSRMMREAIEREIARRKRQQRDR